MERYCKIGVVNVKYNLNMPIFICLGMLVFAPLFMGTKYLDERSVAKIAEMYLALMGLILVVPVLSPDSDANIRDLIYSKKEAMWVVHFIRILESIFLLGIFGIIFFLYLKHGKCDFSMGNLLYGYMANALFLGGMGLFVFAHSDQAVFAYMVPLFYYMTNFGAGKEHLGKFWIFSMQLGSMEEKHYLMAAGILFLIATVLVRNFSKRR